MSWLGDLAESVTRAFGQLRQSLGDFAAEFSQVSDDLPFPPEASPTDAFPYEPGDVPGGRGNVHWLADPGDDGGVVPDDAMRNFWDVANANTRGAQQGFFASREEAEEYARDIPVSTSVWYDPNGFWYVEVEYEVDMANFRR